MLQFHNHPEIPKSESYLLSARVRFFKKCKAEFFFDFQGDLFFVQFVVVFVVFLNHPCHLLLKDFLCPQSMAGLVP